MRRSISGASPSRPRTAAALSCADARAELPRDCSYRERVDRTIGAVSRSLGGLLACGLPLGQLPAGAGEVAGVAARVVLQVVLMFRFGFPEVARRRHFGDHLARPQPGRVDVGDSVQRDALLLIVDVEDRRPVAGADVIALAVLRRRIVDLEEELQQVAEVRLRRVVHDLDRLGVAWVIAVRRVGVLAAGVADASRNDAGLFADQVLHAPETAARQDRLLVLGHGFASCVENRVLYWL